MTLVDDVRKLQASSVETGSRCDALERRVTLLEEQINGERGVSAELKSVTREIRGLRRAAYWVVGVIVAGSIGFAFSVLLLIGPG